MSMMDIFKITVDGNCNEYYVAAYSMNDSLEVIANSVSLEETYDLQTHLLYQEEVAEYFLSFNNEIGKKLFKKMTKDTAAFLIQEDSDVVFKEYEEMLEDVDTGAMTGEEIAKSVEQEEREAEIIKKASKENENKFLTDYMEFKRIDSRFTELDFAIFQAILMKTGGIEYSINFVLDLLNGDLKPDQIVSLLNIQSDINDNEREF